MFNQLVEINYSKQKYGYETLFSIQYFLLQYQYPKQGQNQNE